MYAQAWHLAIEETPLFEEDFEAWVHGPVIPTLYQKYKPFSWHPIDEPVEVNLSTEIQKFLVDVSAEYFSCDAYELEQMTHVEVPWKRARVGLPLDDPSNAVGEAARLFKRTLPGRSQQLGHSVLPIDRPQPRSPLIQQKPLTQQFQQFQEQQ